jgi:hypothetical protein
MRVRRLSHIAVLLLAFTFCDPGSSFPATADSHTPPWGITSPLAGCEAEMGCTRYTDTYPALYVQLHSSRTLVIGFDAKAMEHPETGRHFQISEGHGTVRFLPEKVGYSRTTVGFDNADNPLIEFRIHLLLDRSLQDGRRYHLDIHPARIPPLQFTYLEEFVSPSIQLNQVGYLPGGNKVAFAGNWLGTAGPMVVADRGFTVVDRTNGRTAFQGILQEVAPRDDWSGNAVYRADFSVLQQPGEYELRVPGLGKSHPFRVAHDVFEPVFRSVFRLFYHSRNSTAIRYPWADPGYERPGGVPSQLSALLHDSATPLSGTHSGLAWI